MKNKTARFVLNNLLILMLVLGSLYASVLTSPSRAAPLERAVIPFTLTYSGTGAAVWTSADTHTGSYSVQLTTTATPDYAGLGLNTYSGTINGITALSFWYKHISFDGFCGPRLALTLTSAPTYYMAVTGCAVNSSSWKYADAINGTGTDWYTPGTGSQIWWYGTWDGSNPATFSPDPSSPVDFATLVTTLTGATVNNVAVYMGVVDGSTVLAGDAYIDDPLINGTTYYGMIQDAIDTASAGDTITVAAGTYDESVVVNKGLTLNGATGASISPAAGPGIQVDVSPVLSPVTIDGFTITPQGSTQDTAQGIVIGSGTSPAATFNVTISHNTVTTVGENMGILVRGVGTDGPGYPNCTGLTVINNTITVGGRSTALYASWVTPAHTDWTISGNTFDSPQGVNLELYDVDGATIDNNIFEPCGSAAPQSGSVFIGPELCNLSKPIRFTNNNVQGNAAGGGTMVAFICNLPSNPSTGTSTMDNLIITGNTFNSWDSRGLGIFPRVTSVAIHQNNFLDTGQGLRNTNDETVDATLNWWGHASGPSHDSLTYGAGVSTNVDYMPWLTEAATSVPALAITTTSPLPSGGVSAPYSQALAASGGTPPYQWYQYADFPAWLSISTGGVLSGTPTTAGSFNFKVQVRDANRGIWKAFQINVLSTTLSIITTSLPDGDVGFPYSQTLQASGGTGSYSWSVFSGSLPPGLGPLTTGGLISGTPTAAGTYDFTVRVNDGFATVDQPLSITINPALIITTTSLPGGGTGTPYSETLQATGGSGSYSWSLISGSLPSGLGPLTTGGLISGTPTAAGTYDFTVRVNDGFATDDQPLSITITAVPLNITTSSLPDGNVAAVYSQTVQATGGTGSYSWSIVNGSLPPGLGPLTSGGLISGTPTTVGTYTFTVRVNDGSTMDDQALSITINPALLNITTTSLPDGETGFAYSQTLHATGGSGSYTWSIFSGSLPAGLTLTPGTGVISGTPTTVGTYAFTARVNDGSTTDDQPLSITVVGFDKLLGANDAAATGTSGANYLVMDRFAAVASGSVTQIRVKCTASGSVKVALYTDNDGSPGTLLNANNTGASCIAGGNIITLPLTPVTLGTYYWIAFNSSTNCVGNFSGGTTNSLAFKAFSYSNNFPASAGTGFTLNSTIHCLTAGWGAAGPIPLTITTTSLPNGAVGIAYFQPLYATGGTGSYTWSIISGSLPDGLSLTPSPGLISGTPTTISTSPFTAQVNDGSATASQPLSIIVTVPMLKLIGADDAVATGTAGADYLIIDRWAAVATGSVTEIRVKCTASGNVKVALYTDIAGSPGTLINANNTGAGCIAGWNNITIPSTAVTLGTNYWIACNSSSNCVGNYFFPGGSLQYRAFSSSTDFPASAGTGFSTYANYHSLTAGWYMYGPLPLAITTTSLPDGEVSVAYSQTLQANGGTGSYTWSITSGSLPDGLSLTPSTGLISGTPTTAATSPFTAQVNDGSTLASQPLSITITVALQKLLGADDAAAAGTSGANYLLLDRFAAVATGSVTQIRVKCTASGNVKVALYTDNAGSPGTLINANNTGAGCIAGWNIITLPTTPVTVGAYYWIAFNSSSNCVGNFAFTGGAILYRAFSYSTDFPASAGTGFATYSGYHSLVAGWGVAGPIPLAITTTSLPDGAVGVAYSQTLQASGGSGSYTWSIISGSLPDGLSLTPSSGLISGIPTTAATSPFTAQVNDGLTTDDQPLSITITVALQKLIGADDATATGTSGANYLLVDRFAAVATGSATQIRVKCTASGNVKVALYTDNAGSPGTLINANNTGAGCIAGWNNITIPSTAVTLGTNYWIACNSSSNCVGNFAFTGGAILVRAFSYSTDFPASAGTGFSTYAGYHSLVAGWGVAGP